jgi:hypothetical protein
MAEEERRPDPPPPPPADAGVSREIREGGPSPRASARYPDYKNKDLGREQGGDRDG